MTDQWDRKSWPLSRVPSAVMLGWELDVRPDSLIGEDTLIPMKRRKTAMDKPLWSRDVE
jgi:hypothetical protein